MHHLIYPKFLKSYSKLYGYLTTEYDKIARKGFLKTLKPKNIFQKTLYGYLTTEYYNRL